MKAKHKTEATSGATVLRDVVMHTLPHTLSRPARPAPPAVLKMQPPPLTERSEAVAGGAPPERKPDDYDRGFAEGRAEGLLAGRAQEAAEGELAVKAAVEEGRRQGFEEGRDEGLRKGQEQARIEFEKTQLAATERAEHALSERLKRLDKLLAGIVSETAQRLADAEDDLVALSHEALCRMLGNDAASPSATQSMVKHLLAQHGHKSQLAVHLHPDDLEALLLERRGQPADEGWRWVADNTMQLGGVILRSPEGSLDARLEVQLAALREALVQMRNERRVSAQREDVASATSRQDETA